jgi:hypothetical protein
MTKLIIDAQLLDKLKALREETEFCDEKGHVIGRFSPATGTDEFEFIVPELTKEELERRRSEPSRTLAEIMAGLEKRH